MSTEALQKLPPNNFCCRHFLQDRNKDIREKEESKTGGKKIRKKGRKQNERRERKGGEMRRKIQST